MDLGDVAVAVYPAKLVADPFADRQRVAVRVEGRVVTTAPTFGPADVVLHVRLAKEIADSLVRREALDLVTQRLGEVAAIAVHGAELLQRLGKPGVVAGTFRFLAGVRELPKRVIVTPRPERHVGRGEEHAPALRRCARWQVDEGRGDQGKRFVDPAATLVHDRGLALESGARDRGARPDRRRRGGVAVQRLVVAAEHARDIPERLLRVGTRGRILGAPFDGCAEVVDGLGVRVQLLRAMARAEQPRPRLRIVVASPVVERERIDELVHPHLEQRHVRVADGHVCPAAVRQELGSVRDLLHERVREGVRVLRRAGGLVHEPLRGQRAERGRDIQVRRDTGDDPLPEGPADLPVRRLREHGDELRLRARIA